MDFQWLRRVFNGFLCSEAVETPTLSRAPIGKLRFGSSGLLHRGECAKRSLEMAAGHVKSIEKRLFQAREALLAPCGIRSEAEAAQLFDVRSACGLRRVPQCQT